MVKGKAEYGFERLPRSGLVQLQIGVIFDVLNYVNIIRVLLVFTIKATRYTKQSLHDFRYEGGAPINSGFQIPVVNEKKEYGPSQ